jgi:short-subunit dehydrogenase
MKIVIIGASAGLGRAIATRLASPNNSLALVASDIRDLTPLASDLSLRSGGDIRAISADIALADPLCLATQIRDLIGEVDALFMIAGTVDSCDYGEFDDERLTRLVQVNLLGPIRLLNALLPAMTLGSHIVVASSIAAIRPRGRNGVYGSAKRAVEHYALSLGLACRNRSISVVCYRLGYIRTNLNFGQKFLLPAASPEAIACAMIKGLGRHEGLVYLPWWWRLVALVLTSIPFSLYKRIKLP